MTQLHYNLLGFREFSILMHNIWAKRLKDQKVDEENAMSMANLYID